MHGWINLDKPIGMTSSYAVNCVKRILGVKKAGHSGTLDPLASGVLPIAIGEATKTVSYVVDTYKSYLFDVQLGEQRTTDDLEGKVILKSNAKVSVRDIELLLHKFIGNIEQTTPAFSAISVNGIRAYELARNHGNFVSKERTVFVKELKLISFDNMKNSARFSMLCKKGVYVRSIARDLGISLGCFGYVSYLRRKEVGVFSDNSSLTLERLKKEKECKNLNHLILELDFVLKNIMSINILSQEAKKIKNGQDILLNSLYGVENCDMCYVKEGSIPVAICKVYGNVVKPARVFNV